MKWCTQIKETNLKRKAAILLVTVLLASLLGPVDNAFAYKNRNYITDDVAYDDILDEDIYDDDILDEDEIIDDYATAGNAAKTLASPSNLSAQLRIPEGNIPVQVIRYLTDRDGNIVNCNGDSSGYKLTREHMIDANASDVDGIVSYIDEAVDDMFTIDRHILWSKGGSLTLPYESAIDYRGFHLIRHGNTGIINLDDYDPDYDDPDSELYVDYTHDRSSNVDSPTLTVGPKSPGGYAIIGFSPEIKIRIFDERDGQKILRKTIDSDLYILDDLETFNITHLTETELPEYTWESVTKNIVTIAGDSTTDTSTVSPLSGPAPLGNMDVIFHYSKKTEEESPAPSTSAPETTAETTAEITTETTTEATRPQPTGGGGDHPSPTTPPTQPATVNPTETNTPETSMPLTTEAGVIPLPADVDPNDPGDLPPGRYLVTTIDENGVPLSYILEIPVPMSAISNTTMPKTGDSLVSATILTGAMLFAVIGSIVLIYQRRKKD